MSRQLLSKLNRHNHGKVLSSLAQAKVVEEKSPKEKRKEKGKLGNGKKKKKEN